MFEFDRAILHPDCFNFDTTRSYFILFWKMNNIDIVDECKK